MIHDPLCDGPRKFDIPDLQILACNCADIARIRDDEREQAGYRVDGIGIWPYEYDPDLARKYDGVRRRVIAAAQGFAGLPFEHQAKSPNISARGEQP